MAPMILVGFRNTEDQCKYGHCDPEHDLDDPIHYVEQDGAQGT